MKARATCKRHFPQKIDSQLQLSAASHVYVLFCSFSSPFVVFYHFPLMLGLFTDQELLMQVQEKWETVDTTNCIHELSFLFLLDASTVPYDGFWQKDSRMSALGMHGHIHFLTVFSIDYGLCSTLIIMVAIQDKIHGEKKAQTFLKKMSQEQDFCLANHHILLHLQPCWVV